MLSDREKWLFDLHGFLVLKQVVSPEEVRRMTELAEQWHALDDADLPPPLVTYRDSSTKTSTPRAINRVEYLDEVFQRLALNPEIMRVVLALTGNSPQLLQLALTKNIRENDDIPFHQGATGGLRNPANDYQAANGEVFATFLNAAVSLVDVPPGAGGFVCIPGSHKSNFPYPEEVGIYDDPPTVCNVSVQAGDCVLFTELLRHGARRWTLDTPRHTVFVRYSTSYASWSPGAGPLEEYRDRLPEELYELMQMRGFQSRKRVVQRLMNEMRTS
jgi:hypothetical protein